MKMVNKVRLLATTVASFFLLTPFAYPANHPVPDDVNIKVLAKTEQNRLELFVRVPLTVVTDIQFPVAGDSGYLDLNATKSMLPGIARYWISGRFDVYEDGTAMPAPEITGTRISPVSDESFDSYEGALAHLNGPDLPASTQIFWDQTWLDIRFEYPLQSSHSHIEIRPKVAGLGVRVSTDMKYVEPTGEVRSFSFPGDPGLIYMSAGWSDALRQFVGWGFHNVLSSADVLLFIFCLALPFRRYYDVFPAAAAFICTLSISFLVLACGGFTVDLLWFRPWITTLSAFAILLAALANIIGRVTPRRRTHLALGAGLVFGCGCWFDYASKVQFAGSHTAISALAFNAGIVFAVALAIALLTPVLSFMFKFARTERVELIVVSALVADTAWGWLAERWEQLNKVPFHTLALNAGLLVAVLRSLMVLVLFGGLVWFVDGWLKPHAAIDPQPAQPHGRGTV